MARTEELRELEQRLLIGCVRKDAARVAALLADDFREFGSSGTVYSKTEILALLQAEEEIQVGMKDFACQPIAEDAALVTYRSERISGNNVMTAALRSSLWVVRDARWQMLFHQGTPVNA